MHVHSLGVKLCLSGGGSPGQNAAHAVCDSEGASSSARKVAVAVRAGRLSGTARACPGAARTGAKHCECGMQVPPRTLHWQAQPKHPQQWHQERHPLPPRELLAQ